jgi:hypothetical protein
MTNERKPFRRLLKKHIRKHRYKSVYSNNKRVLNIFKLSRSRRYVNNYKTTKMRKTR